jgi:hypothetical protein
MNREGFWLVRYIGAADWGFGILVFDTGMVVGADVAGGRYDGTYEYYPKTEMLDIDVTVKIPPNVRTVQGVVSQEGLTFKVRTSMPRDAWDEKPFVAQTDLGPVNATLKKIRNHPAY